MALGLVCVIRVGPSIAQVAASQPVGSAVERPIPGFVPEDLKVTLEGIEGVSPEMTPEQLLQVAIARVQSDKFADGRKVLLHLLGKNRRNYYAISNLGFSFEREAEKVRTDKSDPQASAKADTLADKAVALFDEAGWLALDARDSTTAEQVFSRVLLMRPADAPALIGLARVYAATQRQIQAISQYRKYTDTLTGRDDAQAHIELGNLYLTGNHWRQAVDVLFKARALAPDDVRVDVALAEAYRRGDQMPEALAAAKAAAQKGPQQAAHHRLYANMILDAKSSLDDALAEAQRAVELGRQALENQPDSSQVIYELGTFHEVQERALTAMLKARPDDDKVRISLAKAILDQSRMHRIYELHRALSVLADAAKRPQPDIAVLIEMAAIQRELGKLTDAAQTARRILEIAPSDPIAQRILDDLKAVPKQ